MSAPVEFIIINKIKHSVVYKKGDTRLHINNCKFCSGEYVSLGERDGTSCSTCMYKDVGMLEQMREQGFVSACSFVCARTHTHILSRLQEFADQKLLPYGWRPTVRFV